MTHIESYFPLIRQIIRLYHTTFLEPDDLFQEAGLALLEGPERTDEHDIALAIHRAIQGAIRQYEHSENFSFSALIPALERIPEMPPTGDQPCLADLEERMKQAALGERQRQVIRLHDGFDGKQKLSHREIATSLGISINTVNSTIYQAMKKIKAANND